MAASVARASAPSLLPGRAGAAVAAALLVAGSALLTAAASDTATAAARHGRGFSLGYTTTGSGHADFQYALIETGSMTTCSVSDGDAWRTIGTLKKEVESTGHGVIWFMLDDGDYVIRDRALTEHAHAIVQPMNELGGQQGRLGAQQGELGRRQGELGAIQGRIGAIQGRLARLQAVSDPGMRAERNELQRQIEEVSADARDLGARQRDLGDRQRELGERQRELGDRQRIASLKAVAELRSLAEDAVRSGKAERVGD